MRKVPPEILISTVLMILCGLFFICIGVLFLKVEVEQTQLLLISYVSIIFGLILVVLSAFLWMGYNEARIGAIIIHTLILVLSPIPFVYSVPLMWRVGEIRGLLTSLSLTLPTAYSLFILYLLTRPGAASHMKKVRAPPLV